MHMVTIPWVSPGSREWEAQGAPEPARLSPWVSCWNQALPCNTLSFLVSFDPTLVPMGLCLGSRCGVTPGSQQDSQGGLEEWNRGLGFGYHYTRVQAPCWKCSLQMQQQLLGQPP